MSDATSLAIPPGWYPDRNEPNLVRWWDGQQWTDHTRSTAPAAAAFEQPVSAAAFGLTPAGPAAPSAPIAGPAGPTAPTAPTAAPAAPAAPTTPTTPSAATTPTAAGQIAPGWYPDNADPRLQRWWDGIQWTAHTTPTAFAPASEPISSRSNTMATLSLIFSLVSFAGVLFVWLIPLALAGIISGGVALRRARRHYPGMQRRGQAIAGIILGSVSLIVTVLLAVAALMVYLQLHSAATQPNAQSSAPSSGGISFPSTVDELKQSIAASVARQDSVVVTTVTCDAAASMVSGSMFDCGVGVADGRWTPVRVTITRPAGTGMGYGLGFGPLLAADATATPRTYTVEQIGQELSVNLVDAWQSTVSTVTCDPSASVIEGSSFGCSVGLADGRTGDLLVTITPPDGYDVTVLHLPEGAGGAGSGSGAGSGAGGSGSGGSNGPGSDHLNT